MKPLIIKSMLSTLTIILLLAFTSPVNTGFGKKDVTVKVVDLKGSPVKGEPVYIFLEGADVCKCDQGACKINNVENGSGPTNDKGQVTFKGLKPKTKYEAAIGVECTGHCETSANCSSKCGPKKGFTTNDTGGAQQVTIIKNTQ